MSNNPASPFKTKNGKLGKEKKVSWTENIPVADLKAVAERSLDCAPVPSCVEINRCVGSTR